jgi:hypothetical protein
MARPTFVSWFRWTSYKDYFRAALHVAGGERCAVPHVARGDRRAAFDAGSYWTLPERMVTKRTVLERMAPEQTVLEQSVVPAPQHLTSLA